MPPSDLRAATAVRRLEAASGWYVAQLPPNWNYVTPSGGVLMTVAMRAMVEELGDDAYAPTSATTLFCSPVPDGPLEVRVEILRKGNAAAQLRAALSSTDQPGPGLEVSATFARARQGPDVLGTRMPDVPGPEACAEIGLRPSRSGEPRPFFQNLDMRLALGAAFWEDDWEAGDARQAYWYRYRVAQRERERFDPLAIPPIADTMPGALARKVGPDGPRFYAPSLDLTVHFLDPSDDDWFLVDVRAQRARAGYATADADIWDRSGRLVARATQMMMIRQRPGKNA